MALELTSPAFDDGAPIPERFTCDGADVSPPLEIAGVPEEAASLALVADDPDAPAGTWVHCVLWRLPGDRREPPEGVPPGEEGPDGARSPPTGRTTTSSGAGRARPTCRDRGGPGGLLPTA